MKASLLKLSNLSKLKTSRKTATVDTEILIWRKRAVPVFVHSPAAMRRQYWVTHKQLFLIFCKSELATNVILLFVLFWYRGIFVQCKNCKAK
jgi:hypothetical protein